MFSFLLIKPYTNLNLHTPMYTFTYILGAWHCLSFLNWIILYTFLSTLLFSLNNNDVSIKWSNVYRVLSIATRALSMCYLLSPLLWILKNCHLLMLRGSWTRASLRLVRERTRTHKITMVAHVTCIFPASPFILTENPLLPRDCLWSRDKNIKQSGTQPLPSWGLQPVRDSDNYKLMTLSNV